MSCWRESGTGRTARNELQSDQEKAQCRKFSQQRKFLLLHRGQAVLDSVRLSPMSPWGDRSDLYLCPFGSRAQPVRSTQGQIDRRKAETPSTRFAWTVAQSQQQGARGRETLINPLDSSINNGAERQAIKRQASISSIIDRPDISGDRNRARGMSDRITFVQEKAQRRAELSAARKARATEGEGRSSN